jgi:hypothetical protein
MNLATGVKEAKLNEPDIEPVGYPAELMVIDDVPYKAHELQDQTKPQHALPLRPPHFDPSEDALFASSVDSETIIPALSELQDLAHSSHWGVTLTRDSTICRLLLQLLSPSAALSTSTIDLRSAATLLLATAIHNNPPALTAALAHFYNDEWPNGLLEAVLLALAHEQLSNILTRMVFLLSGLCQDETQMRKFLDAGGLDLLARLFDAENTAADERDRLRGKIANFLLDNFLQIGITATSSGISHPENANVEGHHEVPSQLEKEDSWVKLERENEKQVNGPDSESDPSGLQRNLMRWCPLFKTSSTKLKSKSEVDPTTARALENIQDAHIALEKKLEADGHNCP